MLPWLEYGYSLDDFWKRTPRETDLIFRAEQRRHIRQYNEIMLAAWSTANLYRAKRLPKLKALQMKDPTQRQTWQDHLAIMKALTKANTERKANG